MDEDKVYALQRSELADDETCEFCKMIDSVIIPPTHPWAQIKNFHGGCRGIWVEILEAESDKPEITGISLEMQEKYEELHG